jgi:type I restriction enzyme S subunit
MNQYPSYKDSGIEWIGNVPSDWQVNRLKTFCFFTYGDSLANEDRVEGDIPVYGSNGIVGYHNKAITHKPCIIIGRKGSYGKVNFSQTECFPIDTTYFVDSRLAKCDLKWLNYILPLLELDKFSKDTGVPGLNREDAHNKRVPIPDVDVQKSIAKYLDLKTTQIDDLIGKKERMIELLKEERIAIINQAVTEGLNPKAEMKDSGIEWLGKMPKHWRIKKLKFNALVQFSNVNKKSEDGESSVRLCNYVDVYYNDFITPDLEFMEATASSEEIKKFHLKVGDVLLTKDSEEWNDIAIPAYMTFEASDLICGYHLAQVRPQEEVILGKYLFWLLSADCINYQFRIEASGVTRYGLGNYALSNSMCLIPPKREQEAIATFLDKKTAQLDEQVTRAQKSIELLKEYRTSLISEVMTGKIRVREAVKC